MNRTAEQWLHTWYERENRKPLIIRGTRQVGKSFLVRQFAKNIGAMLIEINLEKHSQLDKIFASFDVQRIIRECELVGNATISDSGQKSIFFLDEIQAAPHAIAALRYFYEEKPNLPVIAAGSLLEFALSQHNFSMPVGRIEFMYLGPMTFIEFLEGQGEKQLIAYMNNYHSGDEPSENAHVMLSDKIRDFLMVGGMPEAVREFIRTNSIRSASAVHESIIETYRADFAKYANRDELIRLQRVFAYIPSAIGEKLKYVNIDASSRAYQIQNAVDLLTQAGLIVQVKHTSASGLPLAALANDAVYKLLFLDIGLMNFACGIRSIDVDAFRSLRFVNEGKMAEQFIGQHLLYAGKGNKPELFYWLREGKRNNAEVDYLVQCNTEIIPVEVKAGKAGSLKSLHRFIGEKTSSFAVRFDLGLPSLHSIDSAFTTGDRLKINFDLMSLPLYMVEQFERLVKERLERK